MILPRNWRRQMARSSIDAKAQGHQLAEAFGVAPAALAAYGLDLSSEVKAQMDVAQKMQERIQDDVRKQMETAKRMIANEQLEIAKGSPSGEDASRWFWNKTKMILRAGGQAVKLPRLASVETTVRIRSGPSPNNTPRQ